MPIIYFFIKILLGFPREDFFFQPIKEILKLRYRELVLEYKFLYRNYRIVKFNLKDKNEIHVHFLYTFFHLIKKYIKF